MAQSNRLSARFSSLPTDVLLKILRLLPLSEIPKLLGLLKSGYRDPGLRPILEPLIHSYFQQLAAHLRVDLSQANNQLDYHLDAFGFYAKQLNVDLRFYRAPSAPIIVNQQATLTCLQLRDALFVVPNELRSLQENSKNFAQVFSRSEHLSSEPQQCGIRPNTAAISFREQRPNLAWSRTISYPRSDCIPSAHTHQTHLLVDASSIFADIIVHINEWSFTAYTTDDFGYALSKFKNNGGIALIRVSRDLFFDPIQLQSKFELLANNELKQRQYLILFHKVFLNSIFRGISSTPHSDTAFILESPAGMSTGAFYWVFDSLYTAEERVQLNALSNRFAPGNEQLQRDHFLLRVSPNALHGHVKAIIDNHELINRFFLWRMLYRNSFAMNNAHSAKVLQELEAQDSSFLTLSASRQAIFRKMLSQFLDTYDHTGHLRQYILGQLLVTAADGREINTETYGSSYAYIEEYFTGMRPLSDSSESYLADLLQLDRFTKLGIWFNQLIRQLPLDTLKGVIFYPTGYISQFTRTLLRDNEHLPYSYGRLFPRWFHFGYMSLLGIFLTHAYQNNDRLPFSYGTFFTRWLGFGSISPFTAYLLWIFGDFIYATMALTIIPRNIIDFIEMNLGAPIEIAAYAPHDNLEVLISFLRILLFLIPFVFCSDSYFSPLLIANGLITGAVFYLTSFANSFVLNLFQSIKFGIGETHIKRYEDYQFAKTLFKALTISTTLLGFACLTATVPLTLTVPAMILYVLVNQDPIYSAPHSVSLNQFYRNTLSGVSTAKTGITNWLVSKKLFLLGASQPKEAFSEQIQDKVKAFQMALETKLWSLKPNEFQGKTKSHLLDEILNTVTKVPNALTLVKQGHEKTRQYQMKFSTCQAQQSVPWTFLTQWTAAPNPTPQPEHSWNESEKACFLLGCEIAEAPSHRLDWALKTLH